MLTYRSGDPAEPRGHAILFFREGPGGDSEAVWATYLVVAPIALDLGKYVPAAFAAQLPIGGLMPSMPTAYPLPPMPEKIEGGLAHLERLAELRGDDLLDGGTIRTGDILGAMQPVSEVGQEYAAAHNAWIESAATRSAAPTHRPVSGEPAALPATTDVDDLLLQVASDKEKVGRLARVLGTLRYGVEGGDPAAVAEAVGEMERVGRHLGDKYRVADLIAAARAVDAQSGQLAQLYVERAYKLVDEDYAAVPDLDRRIAALRGGPAAS